MWARFSSRASLPKDCVCCTHSFGQGSQQHWGRSQQGGKGQSYWFSFLFSIFDDYGSVIIFYVSAFGEIQSSWTPFSFPCSHPSWISCSEFVASIPVSAGVFCLKTRNYGIRPCKLASKKPRRRASGHCSEIIKRLCYTVLHKLLRPKRCTCITSIIFAYFLFQDLYIYIAYFRISRSWGKPL